MKSIPILEALNQRLRWLSARQQVISENIANANTPGYLPNDLKRQDFSQLVNQLSGTARASTASAPSVTLQRTDPAHLNSSGTATSELALRTQSENISEVTPNKNGVSLEEELISMADVQMEYNLVLNVYRKHTAMMKTALGRNR